MAHTHTVSPPLSHTFPNPHHDTNFRKKKGETSSKQDAKKNNQIRP